MKMFFVSFEALYGVLSSLSLHGKCLVRVHGGHEMARKRVCFAKSLHELDGEL